MKSLVLLLVACLLVLVKTQGPYPVPLPLGGRSSVHGWLILPVDQDVPSLSDPSSPVSAYFVHHTPEFWTDSPHNFQIILFGTMVPMETVNNSTEPIPLPYPPSSPLLVNEFTFTPPGSFSLNDLLTHKITSLYGAVYNGSFDTSYERYAIALATLQVEDIVTAVYLNISEAIKPLPELQYYSYPRSSAPYFNGIVDLYLSHKILAAPDFDHVIHVQVGLNTCGCDGPACNSVSVSDIALQQGGLWIFPNTTNDVENRLHADDTLLATISTPLNGGATLSCKVIVLEEIHCVIGPGFADICP